jgi:hypothetical protein
MQKEVIHRNNLKIELSRWFIQFLLMLLAVPYGFIVLLMMVNFILPIIGDIIGFFASAVTLLFYYLTSVYFHYRTDKNYTFKKPWWKSNRVYSTLFLIISSIVLITFNKKINGLGITFELININFFYFFIFSIIYTWMLSEFMCKKLKSDKNLAFHNPIWFSKRFILIVGVVLLLALTAYAFNIQESSNNLYEEDNANTSNNFYDIIKFFGLIMFYMYPFLILNFISELKNRSLNRKSK